MKFKSDHFNLTQEEIERVYKERNGLYFQLLPVLVSFLNERNGMTKSERFWEILLYKYLSKFIEDVLVIERSPIPNNSFIENNNFIVPYNEDSYSKLRHRDERYYQQYFSTLGAENRLDVYGLPRVSLKGKIKNLIFRFESRIPTTKKRLLLFNEYYPSYWSCHFPNHRIIKGRLRLNGFGKNHLPDINIRLDFKNKLLDSSIPDFVSNALAFSIPVCFLEDFRFHLDSVQSLLSGVEFDQIVAGWFPCLWTGVCASLLSEKGIHLGIVQHGGNYGENEFAFGDILEPRVCDQFFSWSQKKYSKNIVPIAPTRLIKFSHKYEKASLTLNASELSSYEILIVDGFHYLTPSFGDLVGVLGSKRNIIDFLKSYGDGKGTGVLIRLYFGKYAYNESFSNELVTLFPNIKISSDLVPIEIDILKSKTILINSKYSTTRWEANYVGKDAFVLTDWQ